MAASAPTRDTRDIGVESIDRLSWSSDSVVESLDKIRSLAERQAQSAIEWYYRKKRPKATASRTFRFLAITLATTGGLTPILINLPLVSPTWQLERWGYAMLGAAAACVALDKFFGFSSGWVRYVVTAQTIEEALFAFRIDWARAESKLASAAPTSAQCDELLQLAKDFTSRVMKEVSQETQQWVVEFQSSLADLEKTTEAQVETARPGSLTVTIDNATLSDVPVGVNIDGADYGTAAGNTFAIRNISPGAHAVVVTGQKDGKPLRQSGTVVVPAGGAGKLDLHLPNQ